MISTKDFPALIKAMRYERTPEQITGYQKFWDEKFDGKLTLDQFITAVTTIHSTTKFFVNTYAAKLDKDGDGFIRADEFKPILEHLVTHDPTITGISYENFIGQSDTYHDGRVSIEECARWIEKHSTSPST